MKNLRKLIKASMFLFMLFSFAICSSGCLEDLIDDDDDDEYNSGTIAAANLILPITRTCSPDSECFIYLTTADDYYDAYLSAIDDGYSASIIEMTYDLHRTAANEANSLYPD